MPDRWMLRGTQFANCNWGCPCQFNSPTTHGHCEAIEAGHIDAETGAAWRSGLVREADAGKVQHRLKDCFARLLDRDLEAA